VSAAAYVGTVLVVRMKADGFVFVAGVLDGLATSGSGSGYDTAETVVTLKLMHSVAATVLVTFVVVCCVYGET